MKIKVGKWYMVKQSWPGIHPFSAKVVKIGLFRVFCKWTTYDLFKCEHKRDIETILFDLKSLKRDAQEMAELKSEKAKELTDERARQLGGEE